MERCLQPGDSPTKARSDPNDVDFEALRSLHATQAARLATDFWYIDEGDPWYIIDDADLRNQYGPLIGQIASSHHWDIEDVANTFAIPRRRPPSFLPIGPQIHLLWPACYGQPTLAT